MGFHPSEQGGKRSPVHVCNLEMFPKECSYLSIASVYNKVVSVLNYH